ncbi:hypothetical protein ARALYDRAFT_488185 [Arabidopsis lyrata subsp. lyrata]|uniref:Tify domain-containing protein n=1 Tax=Arabidopsis lyrata subsp. lyrata TaxID=81972 RepID=D7M5V2_ARALL|nr:hypothetical protein ARALYDRAFT_488185 [Arabidopsis lyrata subsp. lyrata]
MRTDFSRKDFVEKIPYSGSSTMELKRSYHQWLTEPSSSQVFKNKRQVVDAHMNLSSLDTSLVPTTHFTDCLFDPANAHSSHLLRARNYTEEQSIGLPVVHGSSFNLDTIRKVSNLPDFMVQLYNEGFSRSFETVPSYNSGQESTLSFGQTCTSSIDKSFIFPGPFASKADGNFIQNFSNEAVGVVPTGDIFDKGDGNVLSTFHPFQKGVENFVLMGQSLQKADCNIFSVSSSYNKGQENFMPLLSCDKLPGNVFMTGSNNYKENVNALSRGESPFTEGGEMAFMVSSQERTDQIRHEDRSQTLSFGDYQKESTIGSAVRVINSYENFSHDPAIAKDPPHMEAEENMSFEFRNPPYASPRVDTLLVPKSKDTKTAKKGSTNTFPSNVKSLLSTGMFDGVTVKYYSWSREVRNLKGIIKGTGYLCGCGNCNFNRVLNAYEFEQHANCKTKHPNNHIYFENGKTIYGVVQELKNTPQEKLFDAIQNVTGSDINHKNFNTWKASYHVASLELQRIYGKDDVTLAS